MLPVTVLFWRSIVSTQRRSSARLAAAFPVRARLRSSPKYMSKTQCRPFSTPQCSRTARASTLASAPRLLMK